MRIKLFYVDYEVICELTGILKGNLVDADAFKSSHTFFRLLSDIEGHLAVTF